MTALEHQHTLTDDLEAGELLMPCLVAERLTMGAPAPPGRRGSGSEGLEKAVDGPVYAAMALMRGGQ